MIRKITDQPRVGDSYVALLLRFGPAVAWSAGLSWLTSTLVTSLCLWGSMSFFVGFASQQLPQTPWIGRFLRRQSDSV